MTDRRLPIDFGRHSDDYAAHRPGFPASFYDRLETHLALDGARALDLGTGPGIVALELAARGAEVVGVDVSPAQLAAAVRRAAERRLDARARFVVGRAERTGLRSSWFDLVVAGQAWHWFDADAALAEARRLLRPGGVLAVAWYSYQTEQSALARDTESLILELNPSWPMAGHRGVHPEVIDDVIRGGFDLVEAFGYDHPEPFTHDGWRGRMRTCNGVGSGGMSPGDVARFDRALADLLRERYPEPVVVPHRVWCVVGRRGTDIPNPPARSAGDDGGPVVTMDPFLPS